MRVTLNALRFGGLEIFCAENVRNDAAPSGHDLLRCSQEKGASLRKPLTGFCSDARRRYINPSLEALVQVAYAAARHS